MTTSVRRAFLSDISFHHSYPHPYSAGQDATDAFYGLHRHEVLERPQYQRLQIGYIDGEKPSLKGRIGSGSEISRVPYAEPTWLAEGYHSPYYKEVCMSWHLLHDHSEFALWSEPS
jgi:hypothetical protein